ncbi:MAG: FAD-dependent monooxygenase [Burkholderiales bacterium]|nr:FAD-dependent monooxygenase [Burkholderiales bacterium]
MNQEIYIIGGGPVGLLMAIILAKKNFAVTIIDPNYSKINDGRVLAISYASICMLDNLGLWPQQLATKISQVHISHSGLGVSQIKAGDLNLACLGYTIKYADLFQYLSSYAKDLSQIKYIQASVNQIDSTQEYCCIKYQLDNAEKQILATNVIVADGGNCLIDGIKYREHDYQQTAIVATLKVDQLIPNSAFERFAKTGPVVLLPYGDNYVMVASVSQQLAHQYQQNANLVHDILGSSFLKRFGKVQIQDNVYSYPLKLKFATPKVKKHVILIGNAAQTVHPISAQGMNLAIRDVMELSEMIDSNIEDYAKKRNIDAKFVLNLTHFLAKFNENNNFASNTLKTIGITSISNLKFIQNFIAKSLIFGYH